MSELISLREQVSQAELEARAREMLSRDGRLAKPGCPESQIKVTVERWFAEHDPEGVAWEYPPPLGESFRELSNIEQQACVALRHDGLITAPPSASIGD